MGNREVLASDKLGYIVPFGDLGALLKALDKALRPDLDRGAIAAYAQNIGWDGRIITLAKLIADIVSEGTYK